MKSISAPAMAAIEAGEALVTGAVEILLPARSETIFSYDATFDYHVVPSIVDADPPEDIVVPSAGFGSTGQAPFGHDDTLTPAHPVVTAWPVNQSLWLRKQITLTFDGVLTLSGNVENGVVFFIDDELVGSFNPENVQIGLPAGSPYSLDIPVTAGVYTLKVLGLDESTSGPDDNTYLFIEAELNSDENSLRVWGGGGPIEIAGEIYQGIGDRGLAQQTAGAIGGVAQGLQLGLSGIEPEILEHFDGDEVKGASVVVRRLIFGSDGKTLLDASIFDRGRVDAVDTSEVVGGAAAIILAVETAARGLGSSSARQRSDSDQRLISATDGYFKNTAFAGQKKLYWGGRRPVTAGGSGSRLVMSTSEFRAYFEARR